MATLAAADDDLDVQTMVKRVLVRALHDDPDTADIPIVIASGSVSEAAAAEVLRDGDQLVPKPFTPVQLQHGVEAALDSTQAV